MTLTDTGPLVALMDSTDPAHLRCAEALESLPAPLITTWACFTEAMYLVGRELGYPAQEELLTWAVDGVLTLHPHSPSEVARMKDLIAQYRDTPMDLADASLVVTAETLDLKIVFSIDRDFYVYRTQEGGALTVVPGPVRSL